VSFVFVVDRDSENKRPNDVTRRRRASSTDV
jgi:hypothetical protein